MKDAVSEEMTYREEPLPSDIEAVRVIVTSTGFFSVDEVGIAAELVGERLGKGESSGYYFQFAQRGDEVAGYSCYGPIPGAESGWDLYWIAVSDELRGRGIGRALMERTESAIRAGGGTRIYIDTSSRPQYEPTRLFYESCGYRVAARLEDFYRPGDSKVVYLKIVA